MSRTSVSYHLYEHQKNEENMVMSATEESDKAEVLGILNKTKITSEDMLRDYTPAEVRELCERTKVRVKMYKMNTVWEAKKRLDEKQRLVNKSESWVNRMLVKAESRGMVEPYSELYKSRYKDLAACHTKKDNNLRLDRWHRQRAKEAAKLNGGPEEPPTPVVISDSESEAEAESEPQELQELVPAQSGSLSNNSLLLESSPSFMESQPESQMNNVDGLIAPLAVIEPPAQPTLPGPNSEPNLWGIGDQDEVAKEEEAAEENEKPTAPVAETQLDSFDWIGVVKDINSESLSVTTIPDTQNTEPEDYEIFGTQVMVASTQDTVVGSQPFM